MEKPQMRGSALSSFCLRDTTCISVSSSCSLSDVRTRCEGEVFVSNDVASLRARTPTSQAASRPWTHAFPI